MLVWVQYGVSISRRWDFICTRTGTERYDSHSGIGVRVMAFVDVEI